MVILANGYVYFCLKLVSFYSFPKLAYSSCFEQYERNDHKGCPLYGSEVGVNGTTVAEACCICKGDGCELIEGFTDSFGDKCSWVSNF